MLIRGDKLNPTQRKIVLSVFVHRWTHENQATTYKGRCPACVQTQRARYTAAQMEKWHNRHNPMMSDDAWIAAHAFHFEADGSRLMANRHHAEPHYMAD